MDWLTALFAFRVVVAITGLLLIGQLLFTSHVYLSRRAFLFFALAVISFISIGYYRLFPLSNSVSSAQATGDLVETIFVIGIVGALLEHVFADRRRHQDSQKLLEQWRLASSLAQKRTQELEILSAVTRELTSSLNLPEVLQAVVNQALRLGGADSVAVFVVNRETGELTDYRVTAAVSERLRHLPAPRPNGLTATVARTGEAAFIADAMHHPFYADGSSPDLYAIASLPLRLEGEVLGVMNVGYNTQPHEFDDQEIRLLSALADAAALAVHNAALHERISTLAVTDDLTGLANRRRFLQTLRAELQRARRYERPLTLLIVDVDALKQANDHYGHAAGDVILCGVSQILSNSIRDTDLAARLGGDEFAVLLPETPREAALSIGERIRSAIESLRLTVGTETLCGTVSIGMVSGEAKDLPDLPTFIRIADDALYKSKAMGRNALTALEMPTLDQSA